MDIENGTLTPIIAIPAGRDENGYMVPASSAPGDPIRCYIKTVKTNNVGKQEGNYFKIASYEVLIDNIPFASTRVKLSCDDRGDLGEYAVISTIPMQAVNLLKILV
ncbi:MAG: hypothetical protein PHS38_09940 [Bacteroidales bacterium]|nr:hypothetical protein [Bacteroidales bacterium]